MRVPITEKEKKRRERGIIFHTYLILLLQPRPMSTINRVKGRTRSLSPLENLSIIVLPRGGKEGCCDLFDVVKSCCSVSIRACFSLQ